MCCKASLSILISAIEMLCIIIMVIACLAWSLLPPVFSETFTFIDVMFRLDSLLTYFFFLKVIYK